MFSEYGIEFIKSSTVQKSKALKDDFYPKIFYFDAQFIPS